MLNNTNARVDQLQSYLSSKAELVALREENQALKEKNEKLMEELELKNTDLQNMISFVHDIKSGMVAAG
tara:strand:- start:878 stop:1084 length:207 start_codon:yes stop_codon:yes gene_type:complete